MNRRQGWAAVPEERERPPIVGIVMLVTIYASVGIGALLAIMLILSEISVWLETIR